MTGFKIELSFAVVALGASLAWDARAIPVPDISSTCFNDLECFRITNNTTFGTAVRGTATINQGRGVQGDGGAFGVFGTTNQANAHGVHGDATGATATGVYGRSSQYIGVQGLSDSSSYGVYGKSQSGIAIRGDGATRGVHGNASTAGGIGVSGVGTGTGAKGVYGVISPPGVGTAVYGENPGAWAGYFIGNVHVTGTLTQAGSDSRLKKNIQPLKGAIDQLLTLHGVTYEWKDPEQYTGPGTHVGFIAQEVEKVFPHWVGVSEKGYRTLNTSELDGLVVESIRSLKTENEALRDRVKALEARTFVAAGLGGNGLVGLGLIAIAGAIVASRKRAASPT